MTDLFGQAEHITIWDIVRHWAGRPMLTKLLKEYPKEAIKEAALKTLKDEAIEQLPYMIAILQERPEEKSIPVWQMSAKQLYDMAVDRGIQTSGRTKQDLINELR